MLISSATAFFRIRPLDCVLTHAGRIRPGSGLLREAPRCILGQARPNHTQPTGRGHRDTIPQVRPKTVTIPLCDLCDLCDWCDLLVYLYSLSPSPCCLHLQLYSHSFSIVTHSGIYVHSPEQKEIAMKSMKAEQVCEAGSSLCVCEQL